MVKPAYRWLNRDRIAAPGPYLTLCLSQAEFEHALRHLRVRGDIKGLNPGADVTTHHLTNPDGNLVCIVCLGDTRDRDPLEVAGLLVHEAVHVWQEYAATIGERNPGHEQEAYAIQSISQKLMSEFARRMK